MTFRCAILQYAILRGTILSCAILLVIGVGTLFFVLQCATLLIIPCSCVFSAPVIKSICRIHCKTRALQCAVCIPTVCDLSYVAFFFYVLSALFFSLFRLYNGVLLYRECPFFFFVGKRNGRWRSAAISLWKRSLRVSLCSVLSIIISICRVWIII